MADSPTMDSNLHGQKPMVEAANNDADLFALLKQRFGYDQFRPGQLGILHSILAGQDTLAVMPTGGGKSLCYQLPALMKPGLAIVISPLISLMRDQVQNLRKLGIPSGALHSGQSLDDKREIFKALREETHFILFVSPERVQSEGFAIWLRAQEHVSLFAVDESHCISQWGHDFRQDYQKLILLRQIRPEVPILALTATATPPVLADIVRHLQLKDPARHIHGFYRPNLYYQVAFCADADGKLSWLKQSLRQHPSGRVIIYCGTRKQTHELSSLLKEDFDQVDYYHAGLSPERRTRIQERFADGKLRILAATSAFGMGIDHPDVRLVAHYNMPANIESLYQEMGRAGRDGNPSTCLLLYAKKDKGLHSYFIQQSDAPAEVIKARWRALDMITQFAEVAECRQAGILTYFRDANRMKACGHCDVCDSDSPRKVLAPTKAVAAPGTRSAKKAKRSAEDQSDLNHTQQLLYDQLKKWRREYAESHDVPAFVVFSNRTLEDLARKRPQKLTDLENIYGFGPHKIEHLGTEVMAQLQAFV